MRDDSQLCGTCIAAGRIYCPPEHRGQDGSVWTRIGTSISEIARIIPPCDEPCEHLSCAMQREAINEMGL